MAECNGDPVSTVRTGGSISFTFRRKFCHTSWSEVRFFARFNMALILGPILGFRGSDAATWKVSALVVVDSADKP